MLDWARLDAPLTLTILHVRRGQWWPALASMGRTPRELATVPGLRWCQYIGCGRGAGFSRWPCWHRYALLGAWEDAAAAQAFWRQCPLGGNWPFGYHAKTLTFWLAPGGAKGSWNGDDPTAAYPSAHIGNHGPMAVLTRARVRVGKLPGFWRTAGPATSAVRSAPGLRYSLGAGTNPVTELCTFSVWDSAAAMQQYPYRTPEHRAAMTQAQQQGWFVESFFTRMAVRAVTGTHPLAHTLQAQHSRRRSRRGASQPDAPSMTIFVGMDIIRSAKELTWPEDNPWQTHRSDAQYDNRWINVTEHAVTTPGGSPGIYGQVSFKNLAVGVVALTDDNRVWLVGQFRYTLKAYSWEIVEGGSPIGQESPEATAHRELQEETGLRAARLEHLLTLHLSNSVSDEVAHIFLATGLTEGAAEPEDTEDLRLACIPLPEALALVRTGQITDAITVAGLLEVALRLGVR